MRFWLVKSEPSSYSIHDLARDLRTDWTGVRNYQARNFMRDQMKEGDLVLFYHSNANPSSVAGIAQVVREGYPDPTAQDPNNPYHDPAATPENPRWYMVDIAYVATMPTPIPLATLKADPALAGMALVSNSRLSVQPVSREHFEHIIALGELPRRAICKIAPSGLGHQSIRGTLPHR